MTESSKKTLLRAMWAEWRKLAPNLDYPGVESDDDVRHAWTAHTMGAASSAPTAGAVSWSKLTVGQMRRLIKAMREESGDGPQYRAVLIGKLAAELFGPAWDRLLEERLKMRFRRSHAADLSPAEAHAEIEELASRIARRDGVEISAVRARVSSS